MEAEPEETGECACTEATDDGASNAFVSPEEDVVDHCEAETQELVACFEKDEEADGAACWEDCVSPAASSMDSCEGFCTTVEQCKANKCSSACDSQYLNTLNCIMATTEGSEDCACTGSWMDEQGALPVEESPDKESSLAVDSAEGELIDDECEAETQDLVACFAMNEEPGSDCWDCVFPATGSVKSCGGFCAAVEQCKAEKCVSGSACDGHYYKTLNCIMEAEPEETGECACTGPWTADEQEAPPVVEVTEAESVFVDPPEEEIVQDVCDAETQELIACFDENGEEDGVECWEECVIPATHSMNSCGGFCADVEQCKSKRCSSGPACDAQYFKVLNCIMATTEGSEDCACTGPWTTDEQQAPPVAGVTKIDSTDDECTAVTQDLIACFEENHEADSTGCWDCFLVAADSTSSCEDFCPTVEQCKADKCSSGSACDSQYYNVLNCVVEPAVPNGGCACARPDNMQELETIPESTDDECEAETQDLIACFEKNDEADYTGCWDCVFPASDSAYSCGEFCHAVDQCKGDKCSSGSACDSQYYSVLNCVLGDSDWKECTCTTNMDEQEMPAVGAGTENDPSFQAGVPPSGTCASETCIGAQELN